MNSNSSPVIALVAPPEKKERHFSCGSPELEQLYRSVRDVLAEQGILRIYRKEKSDSEVSITVCNLWRIRRKSGFADIITEKRDIWKNTWSTSPFIDLKLLPIYGNTGEVLWKSAIRNAIGEIIKQHGYSPYSQAPVDGEFHVFGIYEIILNKYLNTYRTERVRGKYKTKVKTKGMIDDKKSLGAGKALVKNIWIEMIDKSLLSNVSKKIGFQSHISFDSYSKHSKRAPELQKILEEHPNLMYLLNYIPENLWKKPDLFSKDSWISSANDSCLIEKKTNFTGLQTKGQTKWLFSQRPLLIKSIVAHSESHPLASIIRVMMGINISANTPIRVRSLILDATSEFMKKVRIRRLFIDRSPEYIEKQCIYFGQKVRDHLLEVWKTGNIKGLNEVRWDILHRSGSIVDWLKSLETIPTDFIRRSTLNSLHERSEIWHAEQNKNNRESFSWDRLLEPFCIDGAEVNCLSNSEELDEESRRMNHCVWNYDQYCICGDYAVFSITHEEHGSCTLGLHFKTGHKKVKRKKVPVNEWIVDQCYKEFNKTPPKFLIDIGNTVCEMVNSHK